MTASFGNGASVRQLGQALLRAAGELPLVTGALSRRVEGLAPEAWSGHSADAFSSDWNDKVGQARQLAAVCSHVGQVLTGLADAIDGANRQAAAAQQMTGGPASRFAAPVAEQQSQQMLSQASGAAEQARTVARAKLAGIAVPRIGPPLTARQVDAWAGRVAPPPSASGVDHLLHETGKLVRGLVLPGGRDGQVNRPGLVTELVDRWLADARGFARRSGLASSWGHLEHMGAGPLTVGTWAHVQEGGLDGLLGMGRGLVDLVPGPDGGMGRWLLGDPSAGQAWQGLSHLAAVFDPALAAVEPHAAAQAWKEFSNGFLALEEWHKDPARAAGNVGFNMVSILLPTKALALKGSSVATETGETAEDVSATGSAAVREEPGRPPGPPPAFFGRPDPVEVGNDRLDLPPDKAGQLEYRELLTPAGESVPLFDGTPIPEQAVQQELGNCGLVGTLRAVARYRPEALENAIRATRDGRVIVRLHKVTLTGAQAVPTGQTIEVPISREVPIWKDSDTAYGIPAEKASWAAMAEKALAAIDKRWTAGRIKFNDDLWRQQARLRGLRKEDDIKALLGARGYARLDRGLTHPEVAELMAELTGERAGVFILRSRYVESVFSRLVRERKPVIVTSRLEKERADPRAFRVTSGHAYEVTGIEDGNVIMKNPWDGYDPEPVPVRDFFKEFNNLIVTLG